MTLLQDGVDAHIAIVDDDINEADNQFFIVHFELVDAVNPDQFQLTNEWITVVIVDNDGEQHH